MQVTGRSTDAVSVESLVGVIAELVTQFKKAGEAGMLRHAASLDLSFSQLCALFVLDQSDHALAVHELAERVGLSVAAAGRAVDVLVKEDMVRRREDEHDRRVKRLSLSDRGSSLIDTLNEVHSEGLRAFARLLSDEERTALFAAVTPILARTKRAVESTDLKENR